MKFLLFLLYFLVFVPVSVFFRLVHDPLNRRLKPHAPTYWAFERTQYAEQGAVRARESTRRAP